MHGRVLVVPGDKEARKGAVDAYLDGVDGDGKLDHFVVFGELVLRAPV